MAASSCVGGDSGVRREVESQVKGAGFICGPAAIAIEGLLKFGCICQRLSPVLFVGFDVMHATAGISQTHLLSQCL